MVELLVVLTLTAWVTAAVYKTFEMQQKSHIRQSQIIELQQNLRAAMDVMIREIRMAGYDPNESGSFGFQNLPAPGSPYFGRYTGEDGIAFYADADGDNDLDSSDSEQVAFRLNVSQSGNALNGAGKDDVLRKYSCSAVHWEALAENIVALGFAYAYEGGTGWAIDSNSPPDGYLDLNLDTNHDGEVNELDSPAGLAISPPIPIDRIRSVKIWLLGRTRLKGKQYLDTKTYVVARARITPNDNYVHRTATATVNCRNTIQ